jgi:hypothetical protein
MPLRHILCTHTGASSEPRRRARNSVRLSCAEIAARRDEWCGVAPDEATRPRGRPVARREPARCQCRPSAAAAAPATRSERAFRTGMRVQLGHTAPRRSATCDATCNHAADNMRFGPTPNRGRCMLRDFATQYNTSQRACTTASQPKCVWPKTCISGRSARTCRRRATLRRTARLGVNCTLSTLCWA